VVHHAVEIAALNFFSEAQMTQNTTMLKLDLADFLTKNCIQTKNISLKYCNVNI